MTRRITGRSFASVAVAALVLLAVAPAALPADHRARAEDHGLVVVTHTAYQAIPSEARVHVTIMAVATSTTPDSGSSVFYYPSTTFAVQPEAVNIEASAAGEPLQIESVETTADYVALELTFGRGIFFGESYPYQVSFDLPDPGGAPNRDVHVGRSIVAFPVWAFGTTGGDPSSVEIWIPAGFSTSVRGDTFTTSIGDDGQTVLSATDIVDPSKFNAYLTAERPGAFIETPISVTVGGRQASVLIRAWEDDDGWAVRLHTLIDGGLPELSTLIGLPYPIEGTLRVEEAATAGLGDYAGIYDPVTNRIRVRYDADAFVALHEAAHIWFNGSLFADRWIGEAWAEFYGVEAATAIGASGRTNPLTDAQLADRIPLDDWGALGTVDPKVEKFAYAATYHLAQLIAQRTDLDGLRRVWVAADAGEMSYQPIQDAGVPRIAADGSQPGWQRLLDLLEERTGDSFEDLWGTWVVSADQAPLLSTRSAIRLVYRSVAAAAAPWDLPQQIRVELGAWQFEDVGRDMTTATQVLDDRALIAAEATSLGLTPPATLRVVFEATGDGAVEAATAEARSELATLSGINAAERENARSRELLEMIGLLFADTDASLLAAGQAFEAGQLQSADAAAESVIAERRGADFAGRLRVGAGSGVLLLAGGTGLVAIRRRRRQALTPADSSL